MKEWGPTQLHFCRLAGFLYFHLHLPINRISSNKMSKPNHSLSMNKLCESFSLREENILPSGGERFILAKRNYSLREGRVNALGWPRANGWVSHRSHESHRLRVASPALVGSAECIRAGWRTRVLRCVLCEIREICVRLMTWFYDNRIRNLHRYFWCVCPVAKEG